MRKVVFSLVLLLLAGQFLSAGPLWALEAVQSREGTGYVSVHVPFTGIVMGRKDKAEIEISFRNYGPSDTAVEVGLEGLDEDLWEAKLLSDKWRGHGVSRVRLGTDDPSNRVRVTFMLTPMDNTPPGVYEFTLVASPEGSQEALRIPLSVHLAAEEVLPVDRILEIETSHIAIENPAGKDFVYEIKLKNNGRDDVVVDLDLDLPPGWRGSVTPRWEAERRIQSLRMSSESTENLKLTVTPPGRVEKGTYPVTLTATAGEEQAVLELEAVVTGTYGLNMIPETQRLSFETTAGTETTLVLFVWNDGTSEVENVEFYSTSPDGWEVSFDPDGLPTLDPYTSRGRPEQVKMTVKAPGRTIPGDYQIGVTFAGDQASDSLILRATVKVPTKWGWFGVAVIAAVLVLLFGIFWKLKRR